MFLFEYQEMSMNIGLGCQANALTVTFVLCGRGMIMSIKGRHPSMTTCSLLHKRQAPRCPIIPRFAKNEVERLNRWKGATVIVC